jgi:hypothetical protein
MLPFSGIQRHEVRMRTDASKECITSAFRVENQPSKKPEYSRWLESICKYTFRWTRSSEKLAHIRTAEDGNIPETDHASYSLQLAGPFVT